MQVGATLSSLPDEPEHESERLAALDRQIAAYNEAKGYIRHALSTTAGAASHAAARLASSCMQKCLGTHQPDPLCLSLHVLLDNRVSREISRNALQACVNFTFQTVLCWRMQFCLGSSLQLGV